MAARTIPPFRADQVGSLLRPQELHDARDKARAGKMSAADFPDFAKESGYRPPESRFIDGVTYDGTKPNAYLEQFKIGLKGDEKI